MLSDDYLNRFGGIGRLYGLTSLDAFFKSKVTIIGLGGVGSWTAECLARSGVGNITLIDLDDICITNTNRQLPALDGSYGKMKVEAIEERICAISPSCKITAELSFYSERNAEELLSPTPDIVIDAIDSIKAKCHLLAYCKQNGIPIITTGGAGGKKDATTIKVCDLSQTQGDKLASSVRRALRKEFNFPSGEGKKPKKFGIPTVYSSETMTAPQECDPSLSTNEKKTTPRNLNCSTGYGAVTHVTATFGNILAQLALEHLALKTK